MNSLIYVIIACLMFLLLIRFITKLSKVLLVLGMILFVVLVFLLL
ncbi:MAG TPA: hypothetical protein VMW02_01325 [Thermoplasmata archaeon]|nr:hypothetical protein [Thermoplasmata archaeon]